MSSIVLDLQQEVLKPDCDILNALRKAHLIASKLKLKEFDVWIMHELNGYAGVDQDNIPAYRKVTGLLKAQNPYYGWVPVIFQDSELEKTVCTRILSNSISEILELYKTSEGSILISYPGETARLIDKMCSSLVPTNYTLNVSAHLLKAIIDQVQNCLLEWTLRLENEGILGEGMRFSQKEATMAQNVPQTINNYFGTFVNGNIKDSQIVSGDHNTVTFNYGQASDLIHQVKEKIQSEQISEEDRETAEELISEAESKIAAKAKPAIIKAALSGLEDFLIGAGANVAGELILKYLQLGM